MVLAFGSFFVAVFIILFSIIVYSDWKNEELSQRVYSDLAKAKPEVGTILFILNSEDPAWCGKAEYIRMRMGDIVTASRELGIMNENILPIRLGVVTQEWMPIFDGEADPILSRIVICRHALEQSKKSIDKLLVHEFVHLLVWYKDDGHNAEWHRTYNVLRKALRKI